MEVHVLVGVHAPVVVHAPEVVRVLVVAQLGAGTPYFEMNTVES